MPHTFINLIGGVKGIKKSVDIFYDKVLADPLLAPFFEGMEMERIKDHQRAFLTALLGKPVEYKGRNLREAHKDLVIKMGLTDIHFDRTALHLSDTLCELGIDSYTTKGLISTINAMRDEVLNK